ncbi:kinase-like domain-containing protein [Suillus clintonianus]|uniref:kinase-like domain-containing protein n=1 Tax=Suillus clintonianus TaxID=1904413 RepID=UPI001B85D6F8|nr:kinase-like domain-containing protein [Suillus clintonianus]KAG2144332.1 kinase-like domain-containing protein [Suillus clintonianus]
MHTTLSPIPSQSDILGNLDTDLPYYYTCRDMAEEYILRIIPLSNIHGAFRVLRVLAEGGFAKALGAEDLATNHLICLKVFQKDHLKHRGTEEVLLNKLEVYMRLVWQWSPATIFLMKLEMLFQTNSHICFAMELMASDLQCCLNYCPVYCTENARRWSAQLALRINALHTMGIIHRDIKLVEWYDSFDLADSALGTSHGTALAYPSAWNPLLHAPP